MSQYYYSGIGSRQTPSDILIAMKTIGKYLAGAGFTLRSGAADRADTAFEQGCDEVRGRKEIYLPWNGYNDRRISNSVKIGVCEESLDLAAEFHPAWDRCSSGAMRLHARNGYIVLGQNLKTPSKFIVCWTSDGKATGGTGQALRIASAWNIPVFNLYHDKALYALDSEVRRIAEQANKPGIQREIAA